MSKATTKCQEYLQTIEFQAETRKLVNHFFVGEITLYQVAQFHVCIMVTWTEWNVRQVFLTKQKHYNSIIKRNSLWFH